jgi:hypothetical protein
MSEHQLGADATARTLAPGEVTGASVDAVRAEVYQGLASYPTVAKAIGRSVRSVQNLVSRGELQIVRICREPYVVLSSLKDMVARQQQKPRRDVPVRRGRPKRASR